MPPNCHWSRQGNLMPGLVNFEGDFASLYSLFYPFISILQMGMCLEECSLLYFRSKCITKNFGRECSLTAWLLPIHHSAEFVQLKLEIVNILQQNGISIFSRSLLLTLPKSLGGTSRLKELLHLKMEYKGDQLFSTSHYCFCTPAQH